MICMQTNNKFSRFSCISTIPFHVNCTHYSFVEQQKIAFYNCIAHIFCTFISWELQKPTFCLCFPSYLFICFEFRCSVLGCAHNGTRFANGSFVPTVEPCLNCKCINANLICALRVCPEQPFPPPRGCVMVQKRGSCCPYVTCSKLHQTTTKNQDKNVITHDRKWYEQNIKNRIFSQNALQRRIEDSDGEGGFGNAKSKTSNSIYKRTSSLIHSYIYSVRT